MRLFKSNYFLRLTRIATIKLKSHKLSWEWLSLWLLCFVKQLIGFTLFYLLTNHS